MLANSLWSIKPEFRTKVLLLALTFAFLTASQALWRSLKATIFAKIVGVAHVPDAKIYAIFLLIPLILIYSKLVDVLRRHQLVHVFTILHGLGGLIFAYYLAHPEYGIPNTHPDASRTLGWLFYFFMESFSAFLATSFWGFANSINKPQDAKDYYGLFVTGSKVGGIVAAGSMWILLTIGMDGTSGLLAPIGSTVSDTTLLTATLAVGSFLLFGASICIYALMKVVPGYYMHGYEAVYQLEKQRLSKEIRHKNSLIEFLNKSLGGLRVILTQPYVLGIFCLSLFHDVIMTIFDFTVLMSADQENGTAGELALFWAKYFFTMNSIGLLISIFGTTPLQRKLGNRISLLVYPLLCMVIVTISYFYPTANVLFAALVVLRAANYGLNHPVREVLYIPTTKDIKFKAKAWTDAFGTRIAKGSASIFYKQVATLTPALSHFLSSSFMLSITGVWVVVSYFLGRTLQKAIDKKYIIGEEEEPASPPENVPTINP